MSDDVKPELSVWTNPNYQEPNFDGWDLEAAAEHLQTLAFAPTLRVIEPEKHVMFPQTPLYTVQNMPNSGWTHPWSMPGPIIHTPDVTEPVPTLDLCDNTPENFERLVQQAKAKIESEDGDLRVFRIVHNTATNKINALFQTWAEAEVEGMRLADYGGSVDLAVYSYTGRWTREA